LYEARDIVQGLVKDPGCKILGVVMVSGTIVDIVIDLVDIPFVQETKGIWISFRLFDQGCLIV
jgi:hypothetical protein